MEQANVTAMLEACLEKIRERTKTSIGKKNIKESTVKNEFFYPVYDEPVVIQTNVNTTYAAVGIPKRYYDMDFDWLRKHGSFPKENAEAYDAVKKYSDNLKANLDSGKGLILRGPAGTGKTSIAVSILKQAMELGKGCLMISMPNLLDTMLTLSKGDNVAYLRFEQKLRNIPLLLLDDFGAEYSKSDWIPSKVESIIIDRYNRMKPIILTTNYSDAWTEKNYSQRVYDRIRGEYAVAIFNGESHR
ncbi:MAG: ATP-binding protein [Veillonella sp.]|nr:ATP-binding protein [Veillonella sp.]MDU2853399.1 ATP-binding protein [Veillonella sp.]